MGSGGGCWPSAGGIKNPEAFREASRTCRKAHVGRRRKKKLKTWLLETDAKRASQKARAALRAAAKGVASLRRRNAAQQKSPRKGRSRRRGPGYGFEM